MYNQNIQDVITQEDILKLADNLLSRGLIRSYAKRRLFGQDFWTIAYKGERFSYSDCEIGRSELYEELIGLDFYTIEEEKDLYRLSLGDTGELANGVKFTVGERHFIRFDSRSYRVVNFETGLRLGVSFEVFKGAKIYSRSLNE